VEKAKTEDNLWRKERQVMSEIDDPTVLNKVRSRAVFGWNRIVILFLCVHSLVGMNFVSLAIAIARHEKKHSFSTSGF
jgi:hypothetical protein